MMFFFEIILPILIYSSVAGLTFFGVRHYLKGRKKRKANRQLKKQLKQEKKSKQQEKRNGIIKNRENAPRLKLARSVNCLHTAENYGLIYRGRKGRKFANLMAQQEQLFDQLESDNAKNKAKITKKLQTKMRLSSKILGESQHIEPDFVKLVVTNSGRVRRDSKTYIQCLNEEYANEFRDIVEREEGSTQSRPEVAQIDFNPKSKLASLIVSSNNKNTFEAGYDIITRKMLETLEKVDYKNVFPIKVTTIESENDKVNESIKYLNNKNDINRHLGVANSTENSPEK